MGARGPVAQCRSARLLFTPWGWSGPALRSGGSVHYEVQTVGDDELPDGIHQVIVERIDGPPLLILNGEPARCWSFMRAWEDTLEAPHIATTAIPLPALLRAV